MTLKESGHLGKTKTLDRLKERFYWYEMSRYSNLYVKQCSVCNQIKKENRKPRSSLESYHAGYPMESVHLDILGPINLRSRSGSSYILVLVDQYTELIELTALPTQNAELTTKAFLKHFIVTFGCPLEVHTDQGWNSDLTCSRLFADLWRSQKQGPLHTTQPVTASAKFLTVPSCKWSVLTFPEV